MAIKDEVQGVVLAILGAAAGGHLANLTSQAENGSVAGLAQGLANLQGLLRGVDFDDEEFTADVLLNLGVKPGSAADTAATAWFLEQFEAGRGRGEVVAEAVAFLMAINAGSIVDPNYSDIAEDFVGDVQSAVEWSEGDGAEVISYSTLLANTDALRDEIGDVFADYVVATEAQADALEAVAVYVGTADGLEDEELDDFVTAYTGGDVADSLEDAEAAVNTAEGAVEIAASDLDTARAALGEASFNDTDLNALVEGKRLTDAVLSAVLVKATSLADDSDSTVTAKEAYEAAKAELAIDEEDNGTVTELVENLKSAILEMLGTTSSTGVTGINSDDTIVGVEVRSLLDDINANLDDDEAFDEFFADLADMASTLEGAYSGTVVENAFEAIAARQLLIEEVTDTEIAYTETDEAGADLALILTLVADRDALIEALADAESNKDDAVDALAALEALAEAYDAAILETEAVVNRFTKLSFEEPVELVSGDAVVLNDDTSEVFFTSLDSTEIVSLENFASDDVLYIGTNFTQVDLDEDASLATERLGSVSELELFIQQDGDDTVIYLETTETAGNAKNLDEIAIITLVGVAAEDVTYTDGFIRVGD